MSLRPALVFAALCLIFMPNIGIAQERKETLIASSDDLRIVTLLPMDNGLSALTLVWPIRDQTSLSMMAIEAGLLSVLLGGTDSRTPWEIDTYLGSKGVFQRTSTYRDNLFLTITAPDEVFGEALEHLKNVLFDFEYSDAWYARELHALQRPLASKSRRTSDVLFRVERFLNDVRPNKKDPPLGTRFRFGRPSHAILRSDDDDVGTRVRRLLQKMPAADPPSFISKWSDWLKKFNAEKFALPTGVVHFEDPSSSETMLLLVNAKEFENEDQQVGANVLLDYIGSGIGSEMFRIIRQELRASYDPKSRFAILGPRRALLTMSATVEATEWPKIYDQMRGIYERVLKGNVDQEGLNLQHDRLVSNYRVKFFRDANWTAEHFVDAYPATVLGEIQIPLFNSIEELDVEAVPAQADVVLPPFEEYLLVVIGGGISPTVVFPEAAYCSLGKHEAIDRCLERLSSPRD